MYMLSVDSVSWPTGQSGFGRPFCLLQSAEECGFEARKHVAVSCRGHVHRCELGLKQNRSGRCNRHLEEIAVSAGGVSDEWHLLFLKSFQDIEFGFVSRLHHVIVLFEPPLSQSRFKSVWAIGDAMYDE